MNSRPPDRADRQRGQGMATSAVPVDNEAQPDWLACVRALGPMIDAEAAANESASKLSPKVVAALDRAGIFGLMAPRAVGGGEAHPLALLDVIAELSYWDGSAGWYAHAVMTGGAVAGAFLGDRAVAAIFPQGRFLHAAGQAAPTGKAVREGEGYRITGRFSFGSGSPNAQWIVGGYVLHEGGKPVIGPHGQPVMLIGLAPRDTVEFLGNWDVLGLRGTGSYDFAVSEQVLHTDSSAADPPPRANPGAGRSTAWASWPCPASRTAPSLSARRGACSTNGSSSCAPSRARAAGRAARCRLCRRLRRPDCRAPRR